METENYVQMMTDSLIMKKDILEKVIVLSEAQNGILAAAEFDEKAFRENIDEKAELIDKIERLDDGFNSLFARVKETLDGHKDEYKSEITVIKELIKNVTELAVRVQAQEARNKVLAENRFAQMRKNIHFLLEIVFLQELLRKFSLPYQ